MAELSNTKKYGIYPGNIENPKEIEKMDAIDLFLSIHELREKLQLYRRRSLLKRENIDITEEEYAINFMIAQTEKFGVKLNKPFTQDKTLVNASFWDWYKFYEHHFFEVLDKDRLTQLIQAKQSGDKISKYLPTTSWKRAARIERKKVRTKSKHN